MVQIRSEVVDDVWAIDEIHRTAFPTPAEARLVEELRSRGNLVISLVCVESSQVVGHIAFSPVRIVGRQPCSAIGVGLGPVAVLPEYQGRGIGIQLVSSGLARAREAGYEYVVVIGDPFYYRRFGFEPASQWNLRDEFGGGGAFQTQELVSGSLTNCDGLVKYGDEFTSLSDEGAA